MDLLLADGIAPPRASSLHRASGSSGTKRKNSDVEAEDEAAEHAVEKEIHRLEAELNALKQAKAEARAGPLLKRIKREHDSSDGIIDLTVTPEPKRVEMIDLTM
ncbi:hypothetical protein EST38_g6251 [Candolleomyces aberdarensis]|uniref:Uncharacterized protein n=1 Tax=Candolleomyces aberdarensis TaxID=2316362 RepID=A0A4Q2DK82_9AGAR|nr:hypothetical protein EST38_g6251 [Candolleomyces aberdarensis]